MFFVSQNGNGSSDLTVNEQDSLIKNCLCGFHPDSAQRRFPAPFRGVVGSVRGRGREGRAARPWEHLGAQGGWPPGRALFTVDPMHVKETRAVYFMGVFFFHRLHHGQKCLFQLSVFLQRFLFLYGQSFVQKVVSNRGIITQQLQSSIRLPQLNSLQLCFHLWKIFFL